MSAYHIAQEVKPYLNRAALSTAWGPTITRSILHRPHRDSGEFRDELDFGLQQEPHLAIPTIGEWMKSEAAAPRIGAGENSPATEAGRFPMVLVATDGHRYFIKTP